MILNVTCVHDHTHNAVCNFITYLRQVIGVFSTLGETNVSKISVCV